MLTTDGQLPPAEARRTTSGTMLAHLQAMPPLVIEWGDFRLWPAQITAIRNLERSLAANKPRALIQMATRLVGELLDLDSPLPHVGR